jgi:hypothetical protein
LDAPSPKPPVAKRLLAPPAIQTDGPPVFPVLFKTTALVATVITQHTLALRLKLLPLQAK